MEQPLVNEARQQDVEGLIGLPRVIEQARARMRRCFPAFRQRW